MDARRSYTRPHCIPSSASDIGSLPSPCSPSIISGSCSGPRIHHCASHNLVTRPPASTAMGILPTDAHVKEASPRSRRPVLPYRPSGDKQATFGPLPYTDSKQPLIRPPCHDTWITAPVCMSSTRLSRCGSVLTRWESCNAIRGRLERRYEKVAWHNPISPQYSTYIRPWHRLPLHPIQLFSPYSPSQPLHPQLPPHLHQLITHPQSRLKSKDSQRDVDQYCPLPSRRVGYTCKHPR
jgi:hypothetical protein